MPKPVDVGSVLGGRYKVTGRVLASTAEDLVLDGIDQVLNRSVSILLASPANASQITASARELATGERAGSMQVLDLGISDDYTYLVTNRAPAADLLDLVIEQDQPYIEPFFTDTLGSEIFGQARSTEPTIHGDGAQKEDEKQPRKARFSGRSRSRNESHNGGGAARSDTASAGAETNAPRPPRSPPRTPAAKGEWTSQPTSLEGSPGESTPQDEPRVSIWKTEDYKSAKEPPRKAKREPETRRSESHFPAGAVIGAAAEPGPAIAGSGGTESAVGVVGARAYGDEEVHNNGADASPPPDTSRAGRRVRRGLIGILFAVLLTVAVVLSVSKLGTLFDTDPVADPQVTTSSSPTPSPTPSPTQTTKQVEPVPPEATSVLRLVPDNPQLNSGSDGELSKVIDNDPSTYWQSFVFANNTFGGLAQNMALVVELKEPSTINQVEIVQLNGSGGSFTVLVNDAPSLDGAEPVGQGSFTESTVAVTNSSDTAGRAQYVIVNFTQLPRLSGIQAQYPWGLRIAEIIVS